jgi:AcrR family transcriptional regulator
VTGRRPGRPGHNQDAVLTAAVRLFNDKGYEATSISDLADALNITKSTIYHHVTSKQDLLRMAIDHALDGLQEAAAEVSSSSAPAIERLELLIRRSVLVLADRLEFVTLLLRVRGNNAIEQDALMRRRILDAQVTDLVKEAQAAGDLRTDTDPAIAARLMFGMVNSLAEWYRPGRGGAAALADTVVAMAFEGLRTRQE